MYEEVVKFLKTRNDVKLIDFWGKLHDGNGCWKKGHSKVDPVHPTVKKRKFVY